MSRNRRVASAHLGVLCLLLFSCGSDCAREACDALSRRVDGDVDGVGGTVASESDSIVDGCAACTSATADIDIWPVAAEVSSSSDALAITRSGPPHTSVVASVSYSSALAPGSYLFCVRPSCAVVRVTSGATTVNVKLREGPPSFFVAEPPESVPIETFGFEIGFETN